MAKFPSTVPVVITDADGGEKTIVGKAQVIEDPDKTRVYVMITFDSSDGEAIAEHIKSGTIAAFSADQLLSE